MKENIDLNLGKEKIPVNNDSKDSFANEKESLSPASPDIAEARNIDELTAIIKKNSTGYKDDSVDIENIITSILKLKDFFNDKKLMDDVISSTVLGRKNEAALAFSNIFRDIDDQGTGIKKIVKNIFEEKMKNEFESDSDYYAQKSITRARSVEDLFHIFDQFKKNIKGNIVIGGVEKEDLKNNIISAFKEVMEEIEQNNLYDIDEGQIKFKISYYKLPTKYNIEDQLAKIIALKLNSKQKSNTQPNVIKEDEKAPAPRGVLGRLFGFLRKKR